MLRPRMRPASGPQRVALAGGHEDALMMALIDGGSPHLNASLRAGVGEQLATGARHLADLVRAEPSTEGWAPSTPEWASEEGEPTRHGYTLVENGALIDVEGCLMARGWHGWWSGCYWPGYRDYVSAIQAAQADDRVDFVFLRFDTPGGAASGLFDATGRIRAMSVTPLAELVVAPAGYSLTARMIPSRCAATTSAGSVVSVRYNVICG